MPENVAKKGAGRAGKHALTFDVEAWFHAANLAVPEAQWEHLPLRLTEPIHTILDLLDRTDQRATFFALGCIARRVPDLIRQIHERGHEIASHGYRHQPVGVLSREAFAADLRTAAGVLEDITQEPVRGYRAPSYSIPADDHWSLDELAEQGYDYDSSVYPVRAPHGRYGVANGRLTPYRIRPSLWEFPLPVCSVAGLRVPAATGGYLRLLPMWVTHLAIRQYGRRQREGCLAPAVVNVHPWELDPDQPRCNVPRHLRWRHYVNLNRTQERLERLTARYRFCALRDLIPSGPVRTQPRDLVHAVQHAPATEPAANVALHRPE